MRNYKFLFISIFLFACSPNRQDPKSTEKTENLRIPERLFFVNPETQDTVVSGKPILFDTTNALLPGSTSYFTKGDAKVELKSTPLLVNEEDVTRHPIEYFDRSKKGVNAPEGVVLPPVIMRLPAQQNPVKESDQQQILPMLYKDNAYYDIQYFGKDQGLLSNNISSILQDNRGFMWFGTDEGLVRFDGQYAKFYGQEEGLIDPDIRCMEFDHKDHLWLGTGSGLLIEYDGQTFTSYETDSIKIDQPITEIVVDKNNEIWFIVMFGGITHFNGEDFEVYQKDQGVQVNRPISSLTFDQDNKLWASTFASGLLNLTDEGFVMYDSKNSQWTSNYVHSSFLAQDGSLWFGPWSEFIYNIKGDSIRKIEFDSNTLNSGVIQFEQDSKGTLWFLSQDFGLGKLDDDKLTFFSTNQGISSSNMYSFFIDKMDRIWIATEGGGVTCFNPNSFQFMNKYSGFPEGKIYNHYLRADGTSLIASETGLFAVENDSLHSYATVINTGTKLAPDGTIIVPIIMSTSTCVQAVELEDGTIVSVFLNRGIFYVENDLTGMVFAGNAEGGPTNALSLAKDKNDVIWVGAESGSGLYKIEKDSIFRFSNKHGIYYRAINTMIVDHDGALWLGDEKKGIAKIDGAEITYFSDLEGLCDNNINQLSIDNMGRVLISTEGGLNYIENDSIKKMVFPHTNQPMKVRGAVQDEQGRYWISTNNGLISLTPNKASGELFKMSDYDLRVHKKESGLMSLEFLPNSLSISNNVLYGGTMSGMAVLDLANYRPLNNDFKFDLETIKLNGELIDYRSERIGKEDKYGAVSPFYNCPSTLILDHTQNDLTFQLTAQYWSNPQGYSFQFYLDGYESDWQSPSEINSAHYSNLNFGDYSFRYRLVLQDGKITDEKRYDFTILPPWYQTWWAKFLAFILVVFCVLGLVRWRTNRLKKRQLELENQIYKATSEIRTQKEQIEVVHREITDSIAYAKRIQSAILPSDKLVREYINDSFIFYKPKDIVAGDFYWMEPLQDGVLFAVADCTGHGVPGAMVSVVCNNALNRSVREFGKIMPGEILDVCRELVIKEFDQSHEEVRDGMDIGLCYLKGQTLYFSGANIPLWLIRKGELHEFKPDKQPIGRFDRVADFTTVKIDLQDGDTIYLSSDGYSDQFGGPAGKKYKSKTFKDFLISIVDDSTINQKIKLDIQFETWKGSLEQVDDVCVIGLRV